MRQMAVITPYAEFLFRFLSDAPEYALSLFLKHTRTHLWAHTCIDSCIHADTLKRDAVFVF